MKMYDYLIAYHFSRDECLTTCYGSTLISRKKKIKTIEDINELTKFIENNVYGARNIGFYNIILLGRNKH